MMVIKQRESMQNHSLLWPNSCSTAFRATLLWYSDTSTSIMTSPNWKMQDWSTVFFRSATDQSGQDKKKKRKKKGWQAKRQMTSRLLQSFPVKVDAIFLLTACTVIFTCSYLSTTPRMRMLKDVPLISGVQQIILIFNCSTVQEHQGHSNNKCWYNPQGDKFITVSTKVSISEDNHLTAFFFLSKNQSTCMLVGFSWLTHQWSGLEMWQLNATTSLLFHDVWRGIKGQHRYNMVGCLTVTQNAVKYIELGGRTIYFTF